jgi:hypothetical protein
LVAQSQVLQQQVAAGIQPGCSKTEEDIQPMNHAAEDSWKRLGSPAISDCMRFLPTTTNTFSISLPVNPSVGLRTHRRLAIGLGHPVKCWTMSSLGHGLA